MNNNNMDALFLDLRNFKIDARGLFYLSIQPFSIYSNLSNKLRNFNILPHV